MPRENDNFGGNSFDFDGFADFGVKTDFSDTDTLPGSTANSPEYDSIYNPRGYHEVSNMPEQADYLNLAEIERERERQRTRGLSSSMKSALRRVQYWPDVGRFIIPRANTFQAHLKLVRYGDQVDIHFDSDTYKHFDRVIEEVANRPDIFDPSHRDYEKYNVLRENLAVLRNDIMGIYMNDGAFDPGDEKFLPKLEDVARMIGDGIAANKGVFSGLQDNLSIDMLNIEGEGASHAYKFLLKHQTEKGFFGNIRAFFLRLLGRNDHQWGLPQLEQTPFSRNNLDAAPPEDELCNCPPDVLKSKCAALYAEQQASSAKNNIDVLGLDERNEALLHGHTILEWLKNLKFSDKSLSEWIETSTNDEVPFKTDIMNKAITMFDSIVAAIAQMDPKAAKSEAIIEAQAAKKAMQHAIVLMAKLEKPVSLADTMQISSGITDQPERWNELQGKTVDRLMQTLSDGMEDALGALEQQQESLDQQQEEIASTNNDVQMHSNAQRRKRRRKQMRSGAGGASQRRVDKDLRADDKSAGQAAYARADRSAPLPSSRPTTNRSVSGEASTTAGSVPKSPPIDIANNPELRDIGKTLMRYSNEGQEAAERVAREAQQEQQKPIQDQSFTDRNEEQKKRDERPGRDPKRPR